GAAATTSNGSPWLKVFPASGSGNGQITVSVDISGLVGGIYAGQIALTCDGGCAGVTIPATLTLTRPASIQTSIARISFSSPQGTNPAPQAVSIQNGGGAPLSWEAAATRVNGSPWLKTPPASGARKR